MTLYFENIRLTTGTHVPKRRGYAGQDWATSKIYIDDNPVDCHFDQKNGANIYFQVKEKWHFMRMSSQYSDKQQYSFNPLKQTVIFKTKQ